MYGLQKTREKEIVFSLDMQKTKVLGHWPLAGETGLQSSARRVFHCVRSFAFKQSGFIRFKVRTVSVLTQMMVTLQRVCEYSRPLVSAGVLGPVPHGDQTRGCGRLRTAGRRGDAEWPWALLTLPVTLHTGLWVGGLVPLSFRSEGWTSPYHTDSTSGAVLGVTWRVARWSL